MVITHFIVTYADFNHCAAYTESINIMDYSAAVIPVTRADKSVDVFDYGYQPLNEVDRKNWEACKPILAIPSVVLRYTNLNFEDDADTYDGAPVGLQIVARKWEEEKVWAIAKILDTALKNRSEGIVR